MANDATLRSTLVWLAVVVVCVGICTHSFKKMMATYALGMFGIAGFLLPDWDFFDRPVSRWTYPLSIDEASTSSNPNRFRIYPLRVVIYTLLYGFALYKWWVFMRS